MELHSRSDLDDSSRRVRRGSLVPLRTTTFTIHQPFVIAEKVRFIRGLSLTQTSPLGSETFRNTRALDSTLADGQLRDVEAPAIATQLPLS